MTNNYLAVVVRLSEHTYQAEQVFFDGDNMADATRALAEANELAAQIGGRVALYAPCDLPATRNMRIIGEHDSRSLPVPVAN